jgi:F0F1-type ATP synthase assembly protein I
VAREQLRKAYRTEFNYSLLLIALGIILAIIDMTMDEAVSARPIYMVCFGVFGAIFGWTQLIRVGRIKTKEQNCTTSSGGDFSPRADAGLEPPQK